MSTTKPTLRRISLNLPVTLDAAVTKAAARTSRTRTAIIVIALINYLNRNGNTDYRTHTRN